MSETEGSMDAAEGIVYGTLLSCILWIAIVLLVLVAWGAWWLLSAM